MRKFLSVLLCLGLAGCATAPSFDKISIGMPKQDVINALGSPYSISAKDNTEYLKYVSHSCCTVTNETITGWYYVRLVNGKVESYGNVGDFDSAKNPTLDLNTTVNNGSK